MSLKRAARRHAARSQPGQKEERASKNIKTATSMYHAFHVLTEAYEQGRDGKREEQDQAAGSFLAANILGAFGIENALKALIRREGKDPDDLKNKDRHNLKKLYEMLASETQRSICEKAAAIDTPVNGEVRHIRVEGVMDEHQESFQEWRYRESGKDLPVVFSVLQGTLHALIRVHSEKYGEDLKREKKQKTGGVSPAMHERAMKYVEHVLMPKSG